MRNIFIILLLFCTVSINAQDYKAIGRDSTGRIPAESTNISSIFVSSNFTFTGGSPAAGKVLTSDASGVATWGSAAASSQTPWVTNIDGSFFNLTNVGNLAITNRLFVTGVSGLNNLVVTNSSQLGEVTLNGLTHGITNAATEGFVTNALINYVPIIINTNAYTQSANIATTVMYTSASSNMYEISGAMSWSIIPSATTNTITIGWVDDCNRSNLVNVIDAQVRQTVGQMSFPPLVIVTGAAKSISYAVTSGGITGSHNYNLRLTLTKLQ